MIILKRSKTIEDAPCFATGQARVSDVVGHRGSMHVIKSALTHMTAELQRSAVMAKIHVQM